MGLVLRVLGPSAVFAYVAPKMLPKAPEMTAKDLRFIWGMGFGVWGLGFGVWGLGFGV